MKAPILFITAISLGLTLASYAGEYHDLAGQGYRWVLVDGPYACTTQEYLAQIAAHRTDAAELRVVEEGQCYYLIPGTVVQVLKEDPLHHMSLVRMGSVAKSLWTYTRFLSRRPVQDTYGIVEMPEDVGLIWPTSPPISQGISSDNSSAGIQSNGNPSRHVQSANSN
jgi:hypothetical protein